MKRTPFALFTLWLLAALLIGCSAPAPSQTPVKSPGLTRTPAPAQTPRPPSAATATPMSDIITLTWWTPEFLSPKAPAPAGPLLAQYLADFAATSGGKVRVTPVLKARYGKGGLLDFLRTAAPVAPSVLPDIVALDVVELEQAVSLGLAQPLDGVISQDITSTLYSFARQEVVFDGRAMATPLLADLEHVIYNRDRISQPPNTWTGVLAAKIPCLFPLNTPQAPSLAGAPEGVPSSFLSQYIAAGATYNPETRQLALESEPLLRVLSFYRDASDAGLLPQNIGDGSDLDQIWNAYAQNNAVMADVSARRYLVNRESLASTSYAPAPGWSEPAPPIGGGWVLAITTTDQVRQKAAADLIGWLMAPERAGPLAQAAGWLPTSPEALTIWGANPYYEFLDGQLTAALPHPVGPEYVQIAARFQKAIAAVLKGNMAPADAVQAAISTK